MFIQYLQDVCMRLQCMCLLSPPFHKPSTAMCNIKYIIKTFIN